MRRFILIILFLLLHPSLAATGTALPNGHDRAVWGITAAELKSQVEVDRVEMTDEFGYAEHLEEDPEVYGRFTPQHERVEYYFYQGRLYKIFIIYDRIFFHTPFYEKQVEETIRTYGEPKDRYQEHIYGLNIQHTRWEDHDSVLDLRKGAGFIYQVRFDKAANRMKTQAQSKKKSI